MRRGPTAGAQEEWPVAQKENQGAGVLDTGRRKCLEKGVITVSPGTTMSGKMRTGTQPLV